VENIKKKPTTNSNFQMLYLCCSSTVSTWKAQDYGISKAVKILYIYAALRNLSDQGISIDRMWYNELSDTSLVVHDHFHLFSDS